MTELTELTMDKETRKQVRNARALALEWAGFARSLVRHAATRPESELTMWEDAIF
jgi:hypothetical protein